MMAAMDEENTIWIKQEEVDDTPDDADSMGCTVDAMYQDTTMLVKEEEMVEPSDEADSMEEEEEEEEGEAESMDLGRQRTGPEGATAEVVRRGGGGAAMAADVRKAFPDTPDRHAAAGTATTMLPADGSVKRQPEMQAGSSVESLLGAYEGKEMVCLACHRFFLGVSAMQQHMRVAHDGRVSPPPLKKSRPSVSGSSISKWPDGSFGWPVPSGMGSAGSGSSSSESGAVAAASTLGTSADSPRRLACPHCRELLAGKDALATHVTEEHLASMVTTGSVTSQPPLGCSEEAEGLKTQISTALGGLLDQALSNLLERGVRPGGCAQPPSRNQPTLSPLQKLTARRPLTVSASGSSTTGRPAPVYNTELAKQVRRELARPRGIAVSVSDSCYYNCFYCESRFEQQSTRNRHMVRAHKNEIISSKPKLVEPEDNADDASGGEDSDHNCGIKFGTPQEVMAHRKAEHSRPEPLRQKLSPTPSKGPNTCARVGAMAIGDAPASPPDGETIKQQAMVALRELGTLSWRGTCGTSHADWGMSFPLAPAPCAAGAVKLEKGATFSLPLVETSTGSASDSTRLIPHSNESCYTSSEEIVKQEMVVPGELEIGAGESIPSTMCGIQTQHTEEEEEEEDGLFGFRLKCGLREKEFQNFCCSVCLQSFPSKYRLIMHVFIHIDGVEPPYYICKSCGKVFHSNMSLNRHVKVSAGVQALFDGHKCVTCGKSFAWLDEVQQHSLIHTAIKPHKCDICSKSFTRSGGLKQHSLIHTGSTPHECIICGKYFTDKGNLKQHSLIHTGLKPHKCDLCTKSFTRLGALTRHSLIHTGVKPYKCDICGKDFTEKGNLKKHSLIHTGLNLHK